MNTLVIGLGQAGTTIAANITANLYERNVKFINPNGTSCKTFLIDSEAKVISNFLSKNVELSKYFSKYTNIITNSSGRGNNWALGHSMNYKEFKTEKNINQDSFEHLSSFLEKCDFINKIVLIHSLNGGTGSGCGTRLLEMIRDEYPKFYIVECPVFGFDIEKTTLSQFNTFFTLGNAYENVDLIFKIENEKYKKNFAIANSIISSEIADYILHSEKKYFTIEKYNQGKKFVDFGNFEYDYINDYSKASNEKLDDNLFWNNKGKLIYSIDSIYKTNASNNKEYLKIKQKIDNYKKCKVSSCLYEVDKKLKLNRMNIEVFYKSNNLSWINTVLDSIQMKIKQK